MDFNTKRTWGPAPNYPLVKQYKNDLRLPIFIAGPCSVESKEQITSLAKKVADSGATHLRGGVFRAGTYGTNRFGWVEEKLIASYHEAAQANGLKNIIEVLDYTPTSLQMISKYADCFQIGARQMQNYTLLRKLADYGRPIFVKRNPGATLDELLGAIEHILVACPWAEPVIIERGGSTHLNHVRWDLSISLIAAVKKICKVPVIVDAAHGTGRRDLVEHLTLAGIAAGADGCLVEVHEYPDKSLSDPDQAILPEEYESLMSKVRRVMEAIK
jgi:3-deoxy-7-phosphoheptulonate synthase